MRLVGTLEGRVLDAIQESFDSNQMAVILRRKMGVRIDNIVRSGLPWPNQVDDVYREFDQRNTIEELLSVLRDARPAVPEFAFALDELGFTDITDGARFGRSALEALLSRETTPYQDVLDFRANLSRLEGQVCQVVAGANGTGSLVAPDLVLTSRHIVASILADDGRTLTRQVDCVFDKKKSGSTYATPETIVSVKWVEASSPHADEDTQAGPMNASLAHLDYALLRLAEAIGDRPITSGGEARGVMDIAPPLPEPTVSSGLLVLQHPNGQPMKIDIGAVLARGPTRVRHSVNTEPGSSGSPVFDATLRLSAVHHSGHKNGPALGDPGYNQAIPLALILSDAREKGIVI